MTPLKYSGQKFVHLHLHTEYSSMDAPVGLKKLVTYAKHLGYKSLAVTDHGTVGSWVKFAQLCKENAIKPIFGVEAYFTPDRHKKEGTQKNNHHMVMLAKNNEGIKNIYRMMEKAALEGSYFNPRVDWELVEKHHEGVICTSACVSGIVPRAIREGNHAGAKQMAERFKGIFGADYFIELQYHSLGIEDETYGPMARLAAELGVKTLGTNDVHYLRPEDHGTQSALMAMSLKSCIRDPNRLKHEQRQFYLKSPDEMLEIFGRGSQAAESTLEIMDICTAELEFGKTQLPSAAVPKEYASEMDYLEALARKGLKEYGFEGSPVYESRFKEEMDVIKRLREKGLTFDRYFLVVWDYVNYARENNIRVGVGRGSGCGSLVLYCLKITGIDPIEHELLFERFLEESRNEMPDIDIDFDFEFQEKMFEYLKNRYGADRYARIGTNSVFQVASAIKSAFRVFDPHQTWEKEEALKQASRHAQKLSRTRGSPREVEKPRDETAIEANRITKMLPKNLAGGPDNRCTMSKDKFDKKPDDLIYVYADPEFVDLRRRHVEIFEFAEALEGLVNARGVHAAGVILTDAPLVDTCPKHLVGSEEKKHKEECTVFDMADVEKLGLIKMDILATKALSVFTRTLKLIEERHGKVIDLDRLKPDDSKVIEGIFANSNTLAIFQFESPGMRKVFKDMQPDCFADLVAANALYRPGPKDYIPSYCARKHGFEKISFPAPSIAKILKPTFGIMVYQEQVMQICKVLAGFTGSEADKVRKAMGKKKKDILEAMKPKFIKGCEIGKTCPVAVAEKIWSDMQDFAEYAFNKSIYGEAMIPLAEGGSRRLADMKPMDMVHCFNGRRMVATEVVALHDHGVIEGVEIMFDDGHVETCSLRHKFLTTDGMLPLYEILAINAGVIAHEADTEQLLLRGSIRWKEEAQARMDGTIEGSPNVPTAGRMVIRKIVSARSVGKKHMYDLEVRHGSSDMENFAEYGFNKSHACAYAYTAYQCAYLKYYYPVEYMSSQMTVEGLDKKMDVVGEYEQGVREMGIKLLPADINKSKSAYSIENVAGKAAIRKGLAGVPKMGELARNDIVNAQPYSDFFDFCMRAGTAVQSDLAYVLVDAGAFDCFIPKLQLKLRKSPTRKDLKAEYDAQADRAKRAKKLKGAGREEIPSMFGKPKFKLEV